MKRSEFNKLHEAHGEAERLLKHIDVLRSLISGIERRLVEGTIRFHLYVRADGFRKGKYDHGVDAELPASMLQDAVLPVLKAELVNSLEKFKVLPTMIKKVV